MDKFDVLWHLKRKLEPREREMLHYFQHVWNTDEDEMTFEDYQAGKRAGYQSGEDICTLCGHSSNWHVDDPNHQRYRECEHLGEKGIGLCHCPGMTWEPRENR